MRGKTPRAKPLSGTELTSIEPQVAVGVRPRHWQRRHSVLVDRLGNLGSELIVEAAIVPLQRRAPVAEQIVGGAESQGDIEREVGHIPHLGELAHSDISTRRTRLFRQPAFDTVHAHAGVDGETLHPPLVLKNRPHVLMRWSELMGVFASVA